MTKRQVPVLHPSYSIYQTDEFKRSLNASYADLYGRCGVRFADHWHSKVADFIDGLQHPILFGNIDPKHFSDTYVHRQVPETKTTIFFLVKHDRIYLITSGYSGRNWPKILKKVKNASTIQMKKVKNSKMKKSRF